MKGGKLSFLIGIVLLAICISALTATMIVARHPVQQSAVLVKEDSVYDRVIKSGTIKCAYISGAPNIVKDPNTGKLSGIFADAMERVASLLQLRVEWTEEVVYGTMNEGLLSNRYDAVCSGTWQNPTRARVDDFSVPLFYSTVNAYVRSDESRLLSAAMLDAPEVRIATIDGEMAEVIARSSFPKAQRIALPQSAEVSQMLLSVTSGKADVAIVQAAVAAEFLKHNPGQLKNITADKPLRVFGNTIIFKPGQEQFKTMLDTAFGQLMNTGDVEDLIGKYQPTPGIFLLNAYPYRKEQ